MLDFSSTVSSQIRFLLQSLKDTDDDSIFRELCQFTEYGIEASILLLQTFFDHLGFYSMDLKNMELELVLISVFKFILQKPNFSTVFSQSLRITEITVIYLEDLCKALHLSVSEKIGIGLALSDSESPDIRACGKNFCMAQIEDVCTNPVSMNSVQIQNIILFLQQSEGFSKHIDSFMQILSLAQLKYATPFVLSPLLSLELHESNYLRNLNTVHECKDNDFDDILAEMEKETNMGDIVKELGYGCTVSVSRCKEILSLFLPLTEFTLSKILSTVACTHSGLDDNQSTFLAFTSAFGCNTQSDLQCTTSWNVGILVDSIKQLAPGTNWIHVIENLDHEGFYFPNDEAFSFFMSLYRRAYQDPFPLHAICGSVWKNTEGQLSFLKYAVSAQPEVFTFAHSVRPLSYIDAVHGNNLQVGHLNHAWSCLDLLDVLCQLAERGHASFVRLMLEYPLNNCPELLLLGMAHITTAYNLLQTEVLFTVFPTIVEKGTSAGLISHLWHINPNLVLLGIVDAHNNHVNSMPKIVEICQEQKILMSVLEMISSPSGIRLAAIASRKELIDLEKWLIDNLNTYKDVFFQECLKFLREIIAPGSQDVSSRPYHQLVAVLSLYLETCPTFLKVLKAHPGVVNSSQLFEDVERLLVTVFDSKSRLQNGEAADSTTSDGYADDIEAEANSYFHQMFSGQLTIDIMVQMLARFKESSLAREKSIFECMIANLFEEYKFFSKYPERQLKIAAVLFGSVIKHQLVTHLTLGIALRGVLDSLRKPADSKMFVFGTMALEQFVDRLIEWPQYCNHILQISHLRGTHPELIAFIERALAKISSGHIESDGNINSAYAHHLASGNVELNELASTHPGKQPSSLSLLHQRLEIDDRAHKGSATANDFKPVSSIAGQVSVVPSGNPSSTSKLQNANSAQASLSPSLGFSHPSRGATSARFGSALNIETLVAAAERRETPIEAPALAVQDKISFIINNISVTNVEVKAKEFAEILMEQYYPWFAQYMVMKRASIEPNFHDLYLKFMDKVNSKALNKEILQASYENCKVLLRSELIKSSSEERSLLKNLGSWLGKLTIGRNQVLRAREIDPKSLIVEAYEKGLMIAVIPFTSKILEPCQSSLAYQPPNPWTMGILGLLAEIYLMPNLKMNLKFDIEVLFKNLGVDMKEITPSSLLKDRVREVEGNPDFSNKDLGASKKQMAPESKSGMVPPLNQVDLPLEVASPSNSSGRTHMLSQYAAPLHLHSGALMNDEKLAAIGLSDQLPTAQAMLPVTPSQPHFSVSQLSTPIPNIGNHVIINQKLIASGLHLHFQRVVPVAMDRAIKEIVLGIVQRSVSIATQTTKELVLKDYAVETDETRIYNAAHLMVASLAGSLAHVTCKEPLRSSISSQLKNSLQVSSTTSELLEQAVQLVTNDNLDLGCAVIEQAATDKAIQTIDGEIAQQLALRRKRREGIGSAYLDANLYSQGSIDAASDTLRSKSGHLSLSQQRVYEDFVRLPWQNQSVHGSHALPAGLSALSSSANLTSMLGSASTQLNPAYSSGIVNSRLEAVSGPMDVIPKSMEPSPPLSASPVYIGEGGNVTQHGSENDHAIASFPPIVSSPESHLVEPLNVEFGTSVQPLPLPIAMAHPGSSIFETSLSTKDALDKYQSIVQKLESLISNDAREVEFQDVIAEIPEIILRCISLDEAALAMAQKVFNSIYENASNSVHVAVYLGMLGSIRDISKLVAKELTSWVIYSDEERKFNKDITVGLIRRELLNLAEYNVHMAELIDRGRNKVATEFAISLLQTLITEESHAISELPNLVDGLVKLAARHESPESIQELIEMIGNPVGNAGAVPGISVEKEDKVIGRSIVRREGYNTGEPEEADLPGFQEQVSLLFAEWCRICELPGPKDAACNHYILQLHQNGLLRGDDTTDRVFRLFTELSVAHCLSSEVANSGSPLQVQSLLFLAIDVYAKLVFSILRYFPVEQGSSKLYLLSKLLAITVRSIQKDIEDKKASFNPRPYFRLFINLLVDLGSLDPVTEGANLLILAAFANAFHALQPLKFPAFSFAWLELVSHRSFMPKLLTGNSQKGWPYIQRLLVDLFQFLEPFLRNAELAIPVHFLYKGTLRVLLVLLHDFPEFLCDYHFTFCDVIPPSCIQMRNIILSAFPRNMRLPDPSTPNLKIDLLAEITILTRVQMKVDVDAVLKANQMKVDVDEYLKTRQAGSVFLSDMKRKLLLPPGEAAQAGTCYNVPLINSLVLYVGMQAIQQLQARTANAQSAIVVLLVGAALDIFQTLVAELDAEGRYLFLNSIANQLRYPNNHTHYFSSILLHLFTESNQEIIQEQITRVLLERLIVNRPHPWGLLITFIKLIKNPIYNFWNRSFIRCAPEIDKLLESASRSCGGPKPSDESLVSSWMRENK